MKPTLFISDLHLDARFPAGIVLFEQFLAGPAQQAEKLYILGDFFEYWIGDDHPDALLHGCLEKLAELAAGGVGVFFMVGNRDFLFSSDLAQRYRMELLPDPSVIRLNGEKVLLLHGDSLCTLDQEYMQFRRLLRDSVWQQEFLQQPLAERQSAALELREKSEQGNKQKDPALMDVALDSVEAAFQHHGVRRIIHGHTHHAGRHWYMLDGQRQERIVLGNWSPAQGSWLCCDQGGFALREFLTSSS